MSANRLDPQADTHERHRRNWQRLVQGGGTNLLTLAASSGLEFVSGDLRIDLIASSGLVLSASGIGIQLNGASLALGASGLNIAVRDFGDITTTSNGTVWTIDAGVVTLAKMANLATDRIIGRQTAGTGVPEAITCTAAGRNLIDDADASAQRTTLGLGTIATQAANSVAITGGSITGVSPLRTTGGLGVGNSAAATTLGTVVAQMEIFDASGNSLGFIPIYDAIT
jgi:hypothetical protein